MTTETIDFEYSEKSGIIRVAWEDIFEFTGDFERYDERSVDYDEEIVQQLLNSGAPKWVNYAEGGLDDQYWYVKRRVPLEVTNKVPAMLQKTIRDLELQVVRDGDVGAAIDRSGELLDVLGECLEMVSGLQKSLGAMIETAAKRFAPTGEMLH